MAAWIMDGSRCQLMQWLLLLLSTAGNIVDCCFGGSRRSLSLCFGDDDDNRSLSHNEGEENDNCARFEGSLSLLQRRWRLFVVRVNTFVSFFMTCWGSFVVTIVRCEDRSSWLWLVVVRRDGRSSWRSLFVRRNVPLVFFLFLLQIWKDLVMLSILHMRIFSSMSILIALKIVKERPFSTNSP